MLNIFLIRGSVMVPILIPFSQFEIPFYYDSIQMKLEFKSISANFWDVVPYSLIKVYQHFKGPWRWRQYVFPTHWLTCVRQHGVTLQMSVLIIVMTSYHISQSHKGRILHILWYFSSILFPIQKLYSYFCVTDKLHLNSYAFWN